MKRVTFPILTILALISLTGCEDKGFRTADGNPATWDEYPQEYLEKPANTKVYPTYVNTKFKPKETPDQDLASDAVGEGGQPAAGEISLSAMDEGEKTAADVSDMVLNETYLIIANEKYKSGAERLQDLRKEQFGVMLEYVSSTISAEGIRDIIEKNTNGFAYVVLIGACEDIACYTKTRTYQVYINGSKNRGQVSKYKVISISSTGTDM